MNGEERRNQIVDILKHSSSPVPGTQLAQILDVSRQVIVQDIALIRAKNIDVFSTNRGYVLNDKQEYSRILKVKHEDDEVEAELGAIVDMGGWIRDVFVYHKVYGVIRARKRFKRNHQSVSDNRETYALSLCGTNPFQSGHCDQQRQK